MTPRPLGLVHIDTLAREIRVAWHIGHIWHIWQHHEMKSLEMKHEHGFHEVNLKNDESTMNMLDSSRAVGRRMSCRHEQQVEERHEKTFELDSSLPRSTLEGANHSDPCGRSYEAGECRISQRTLALHVTLDA